MFGEQSIAVLSGAYRNPIEMARHVAARCGSQQPFFVMDVAAIERRLEEIRVIMPRIRPSYAVACNADPVLARVLSNNADVSFEVSNSAELELAGLYVEPNRAVFCSHLMTRKSIKTAAYFGCGTFVVESEKQINDVMNASPDAEIVLAVCLPYFSGEVPFGCSVEELDEILDMAHLLGTNVTGIHLELGIRATLEDYINALHDARSILDRASEKFLDLRHVSLGNLVIPTGPDGIVNQDFLTFCNTLSCTINELFESHIDFSANIGRFLVTNAFTLCTNVIGKREMDAKLITNDDFDDGVGFVYQTNEGVYGSFGCKQMDINPLCKPLNLDDEFENEHQLHFGTILGPTLDQTDVAQRIMKSRQLRIGEWLVWEQMGAFTIPVDSEHPVPPVYYYSGKECWQKLLNKDEQRRSPSPNSIDNEDIGSDGEGGYASSCEDSETEIVLEPVAEDPNEF
uniref:Orn_Arg_deC_N domain-containing protein n=1 Tax=Caenorhabditis tropicalis TaxID=1561998 RepID=A0A1I7TK95_9PELO